uniref:NADH-ubiquinone oxidoreductase chain 2 n=1 Tax=Phloiophilus edwardsi TaxID=295730 RepID=A0A0S2MR22_9CUCU|nr:NADH deshydrogenase subunit 2 [Phloiophilus edwardsi]
MKLYKIYFYSLTMMGTLISISSYSYIGIWLGLEMNLLSVIPLFSSKTFYKNDMYSSESSMKYFITQIMASSMILLAFILFSLKNDNLMINSNSLTILFNSSLLMKMGTAPFHFWFPMVMEGLNWMNCFILLTWQKIAPMVILMYNMNLSLFMYLCIIMAMIISGLMGINQTSMRKIMAYSSINHIGWMLSIMFYSQSIWLLYFSIYSIISLNLILIFNSINLININQFIFNMNKNFMLKMFFILNFLSLGGLPPLLGFLPKWLIINVMIMNKSYLIPTIMILFTLMTLFFYMRIIFSISILNSLSLIEKSSNKNFWMLISYWLSISGLILVPTIFDFM